ncbi:MAG: iron-containing alcohol dehydrogenase [Candidatus Izemoplasma sp.]|nr:iron-containing alcohol dehydrogenase [Candidatus Izemoplasma sp.]
MKNFVYHSPTKILFGKDQINELGHLLTNNNVSKMLLVYGRKSIKENGIYDAILNTVNALNIELYEESGVTPNPDITSVRSGIQTVKMNDIDFILAAGGGSVADCSKAIAMGALIEEDPWDIYLNKATPTHALPLGVIITLAATGSETNGNSVISNREENEKRAAKYQFCKPTFAIIDPSYTLTVNRHHTVAGSIDTIMHTLEQYFAKTKHTETTDYMMTGLINAVIKHTNAILSGNDSYDARANISWASTIALNWILGVDKQGDWATHRLSYAVTQSFGTTHAYALAALFTSWAKVALEREPEAMIPKLKQLGKDVFGVTDPINVLDQLDSLFESWGAKTRLKLFDETITQDDVKHMAAHTVALGPVGHVITVDQKTAETIFNLSLK